MRFLSLKQLRLGIQEGRFSRSLLFRPLSGLWYLGAKAKNWLYDQKILSIEHLPVPVISVGAITAGGSGKTPLVHLLAKILQNYGSVAILSRGYRGGDEALLLQKRLPKVPVLIGKNRIASGKAAIRNGAQLLILDDGFQYRALHRNFELIALSEKNPYGYGAFLPRGLLRDPPSRLKEATSFFINGELPHKFSAPVISVQMKMQRLLDLQGREHSALGGKKIGAFCAIAHPDRFFETLKNLHFKMVDSWRMPDHEKPNLKELSVFAAHCQNQGAVALLCTEKDAVKIPKDFLTAIPILYLEMELEVISGELHWKNLIEKIVINMNNYTNTKYHK